MALDDLDPIVLGHNNFFGVDHLSQERGAARSAQFERIDAILHMIRASMDFGVKAVMMSTHPRATLVADAVRQTPELRDELGFYPLLPYIAKYVRRANERGMINVVLDQIKGAGIGQKLQIVASGGMAMVRKDMLQVLRTLLQMELTPFRSLKLRAVFLHDVLTDLALALDIRSAFEVFMEQIGRHSDAEPAFATKNPLLLAQRFREYGFEKPLVLAHVNKMGFGMNPSRKACEDCLKADGLQVMAMGTLASGYLKPAEAYEYLGRLRTSNGLPAVSSIVVGASTPPHAEETFASIRRSLSPRISRPTVNTAPAAGSGV